MNRPIGRIKWINKQGICLTKDPKDLPEILGMPNISRNFYQGRTIPTGRDNPKTYPDSKTKIIIAKATLPPKANISSERQKIIKMNQR